MMLKKMLVLCAYLLNSFGDSSGESEHMICKKIKNVFESDINQPSDNSPLRIQQGRPGKIGPKGEVGPRGPSGNRGPIGVVDYERVNSTTREIVSKAISDSQEEMEREWNEKLGRLDEKYQSIVASLKQSLGHCVIAYGGVCSFILKGGWNWSTSLSTCTNVGAHPADIFDKEHLNLLKNYIRKIAMLKTDSWVVYYTGMQYSVQTKQSTLYNGANGGYVEWYPNGDEPLQSSLNKYVVLGVRKDENQNEGMFTRREMDSYHGVICQFEI
ncbi:uncharacterized protein LOC120346310 isoform X1 [Styela clava]